MTGFVVKGHICSFGKKNDHQWKVEVLLELFCGNHDTFFSILNRNEKKIYILSETFCNIINVFTVSFDQFNASLLNKNILIKIEYRITQTFEQ